jgi:hypothetical protein
MLWKKDFEGDPPVQEVSAMIRLLRIVCLVRDSHRIDAFIG